MWNSVKTLINFIFSVKKVEQRVQIILFGFKIKLKDPAFYTKREYEDIIITINYFSSQFNLNKDLIDRIKFNSKHYVNKKTLKKDKTDLQKHFDKVIIPSKIKPATGTLREFQLRILDIMKEVVLPAQKDKHIPTLSYGSLLGCIRHNGHFIPWDDDADFDFLRDDYIRFINYAKNKYIFMDSSECKNTVDFWHILNPLMEKNPDKIIITELLGYLQVYKGKSASEHAMIDFFPWDYITNDTSIQDFLEWHKSFKKKFNNKNITWGYIDEAYRNELNSNKIFGTPEDSIRTICNFGTRDIFRGEVKTSFLPVSLFKNKVKCNFEGAEFYIPKDYNQFLTWEYSDWEKIPANINYAKDIKSLNLSVKSLFGKNFYINYDDLCSF